MRKLAKNLRKEGRRGFFGIYFAGHGVTAGGGRIQIVLDEGEYVNI